MKFEHLLNQMKNINLGTFNKRSFWIALVGGFLMALLQNVSAGFSFFSPLPDKAQQVQAEVIEEVLPMLHKKAVDFLLTQNEPDEEVEVYANAYIVVDMESGEILSERNSDTALPIASLTKVMTSVVALDLADPSEQFEVSERASKIPPTKIGVVPGEKMTVDELLHAVLLTSANDASEVVKEGIDTKYRDSIFIDAMNEKAKFLGMKNSHFVNPQGFDAPGHLSSAKDLAILSMYAMKNYPKIAEIAKKDYAFLPKNNSHKQFDLNNWNGLIGVYPNTFGLKTGVTENAGNTTIVMSERGGKKVLTVLLGTSSIIERDLEAAILLNAGFEALKSSPFAVDESMLREKYGRWAYWN